MIIDYEKDRFTIVKNDYIKDLGKLMTNEEITIYTLINLNKTIKDSYIFSISWIMEELHYSNTNKKKLKQIKDIINGFIANGIINVYTNIRLTDEYKINNIDTKFDKNKLLYATSDIVDDNFTIIYDCELIALLDIADKYELKTSTLIKLVLYIFSCIGNNECVDNYKLAYPTFKTISDDLGICESTIVKYINILKQEKIIDFDYAGYKETAKGKIKNSNMFYCRYMDNEVLRERIKRERETKGFIQINNLSKNKSNLKRGIKQQINVLEKKDKLTELEIEKIELLKEQYEKL